jgi:hypothetical protein
MHLLIIKPLLGNCPYQENKPRYADVCIHSIITSRIHSVRNLEALGTVNSRACTIRDCLPGCELGEGAHNKHLSQKIGNITIIKQDLETVISHDLRNKKKKISEF